MFLEISQNSRENICARKPATLIKKETLAEVFSHEFCEISKNTFLYRAPMVAASEVTVVWSTNVLKLKYQKTWIHSKFIITNLPYTTAWKRFIWDVSYFHPWPAQLYHDGQFFQIFYEILINVMRSNKLIQFIQVHIIINVWPPHVCFEMKKIKPLEIFREITAY